MMANTFLVTKKIISGSKALHEAASFLAGDGKKVFIVTDPMMIRLGNLKKVTEELDEQKKAYSVWSEIDHEPDDLMIQAGVTAYKSNGCDSLIALGGGSAIDAMKAIGFMIQQNQSIGFFMGKRIDCDMPHMCAIPTTAGTGSEATKFTIINDTNTKIKMLLTGECLMPDLAVIDPQFTMTAPKSVTAATGIDALCHCTEAFTSRKAQPLSDTFALSAAKRIFENLQACYDEPANEHARIQMSLAAIEAGIAFNNSSVTIVHGMSRPIGALFHIAHGLSNAILLEGCMRFVADGAYNRFGELSRSLGLSQSLNDEKATNDFITAEAQLLKNLQIPTMSQLGIDRDVYEENIPKMARDAFASGSPSNTIKEISVEDIENLYRKIYR